MASVCSIMPGGQAFAQFDFSSGGILPPTGVPLPGTPGNPFPGSPARRPAGPAAVTIPQPSGAAGAENANPEGMTGDDVGVDAATGLPTGFSMSSFGEISEIYTTNGTGVRNGLGSGGGSTDLSSLSSVRTGIDWVTRLNLGLQAHDVAPRFQGHLNYQLTGFVFGRNGALDTVRNSLTTLATAVLVPEHVLLNARAFALPVLINQLGPLSATDTPTVNGDNSGLRNTYGYVLAPTLLYRLGDYVNSNTTVTQNSFFVERPGPEVQGVSVPGVDYPINSVGIGASEQLSSGTYFARLSWDLLGSYNKFHRPNANVTSKTGMANMQYAVTRLFSILTTTGYQDIDIQSALGRNRSGWTLLGGGQLTLSPSVSGSLRAGTQFNRFSYVGNFDIELTPATTLTGTLTDGVRTPGQNLFGGLQNAGVADNGDFYDTESTPQGFGNYTSQFSLAPQGGVGFGRLLSRFRTTRVSLSHTDDRMEYKLSGYRTVRDVVAVTQASDIGRYLTMGVQASVLRHLRPDLTVDLTGIFLNSQLGANKNFDIYRSLLTFRYNATPDLQFFLTGAYLRRISEASLASQSPFSGNLADISVILGVRRDLF